MGEAVTLREVAGHAGAACREILESLPTWFGVPEANRDYIDTADTPWLRCESRRRTGRNHDGEASQSP